MGTETAIPQPDRKREAHLSADGKWRSFPRVPNLLQYVNSGVNFGRNTINSKVVQGSALSWRWSSRPKGLPLAYKMFPGKTADKTTLRDMLKLIQQRYGSAERIWVMDCGIPTEAGLAELR